MESAFSGSLESHSLFCVSAFGRNLASFAMNMFSHLICSVKTFHKFCTFNVICRNNAVKNYVTIQCKKGSFLSATLVYHMKINPLCEEKKLNIAMYWIQYPLQTEEVPVSNLDWRSGHSD